MKKIIVLLVSFLVVSCGNGVTKDDILSKYYDAVSTHDGDKMLTLFNEKSLIYTLQNGMLVSMPIQQWAAIINQFKGSDFKESEEKRLKTMQYDNQMVVVSQYKIELQGKITHGTKIITVMNGQITHMQYLENKN